MPNKFKSEFIFNFINILKSGTAQNYWWESNDSNLKQCHKYVQLSLTTNELFLFI